MQPKTLTIGVVLALVALTCLIAIDYMVHQRAEQKAAQQGAAAVAHSLMEQMRNYPDQSR